MPNAWVGALISLRNQSSYSCALIPEAAAGG
jgi:hypothetical protein